MEYHGENKNRSEAIKRGLDQIEKMRERLKESGLTLKKNGEPRSKSERWSLEEDKRFIEALKIIGKSWREVAAKVATKNES